MLFRRSDLSSAANYQEQIRRLKKELETADAVIIGAGAGLSAAAGMQYTGTRFKEYFEDFYEKYRYTDMYSGGFYPYDTPEEHWAYWSRYIFINRYMDAPEPVYQELNDLVKDKDYFVLTTNVDHCFQKAGFDRQRLFYTQGDYGLFQCSVPCHDSTYDNEEAVRQMVLAQGYEIDGEGRLFLPDGVKAKMEIPSEIVPLCPRCGKPMSMNLRADDTFVQDQGWYMAAKRYQDFVRCHAGMHILYLELGVGANTPVIIKYPFWQMTARNPKAVYVCINYGEALCPQEIESRSLCMDRDIKTVLEDLKGK